MLVSQWMVRCTTKYVLMYLPFFPSSLCSPWSDDLVKFAINSRTSRRVWGFYRPLSCRNPCFHLWPCYCCCSYCGDPVISTHNLDWRGFLLVRCIFHCFSLRHAACLCFLVRTTVFVCVLWEISIMVCPNGYRAALLRILSSYPPALWLIVDRPLFCTS